MMILPGCFDNIMPKSEDTGAGSPSPLDTARPGTGNDSPPPLETDEVTKILEAACRANEAAAAVSVASASLASSEPRSNQYANPSADKFANPRAEKLDNPPPVPLGEAAPPLPAMKLPTLPDEIIREISERSAGSAIHASASRFKENVPLKISFDKASAHHQALLLQIRHPALKKESFDLIVHSHNQGALVPKTLLSVKSISPDENPDTAHEEILAVVSCTITTLIMRDPDGDDRPVRTFLPRCASSREGGYPDTSNYLYTELIAFGPPGNRMAKISVATSLRALGLRKHPCRDPSQRQFAEKVVVPLVMISEPSSIIIDFTSSDCSDSDDD
jgi:hypothetical protein